MTLQVCVGLACLGLLERRELGDFMKFSGTDDLGQES